MKATRADRKKKAPPTPEPARPGFPNRRRLLLAGSVAALVLAGGVWLLLARDDGKPPGPAPEGMVWIPPGRFSTASTCSVDSLRLRG